MVKKKMLFEVKQLADDESFQLTHNGNELIISRNKNELVKLAEYLNTLPPLEKFQEYEVLCIAQSRLIEYYQTLITNIIHDKLSNLDNLYAMKMMLNESVNILGQSNNNLEETDETIK